MYTFILHLARNGGNSEGCVTLEAQQRVVVGGKQPPKVLEPQNLHQRLHRETKNPRREIYM